MGYILDELKELSREFSIHLGFEGGEAETPVLDCSLFNREVRVMLEGYSSVSYKLL